MDVHYFIFIYNDLSFDDSKPPSNIKFLMELQSIQYHI
jgi:hypothetical protein